MIVRLSSAHGCRWGVPSWKLRRSSCPLASKSPAALRFNWNLPLPSPDKNQAAQIDEAAQIVGQLPQVDGDGSREPVGRAAAVDAEEIGLALQAVDHRPLIGLMHGHVDRHRLVPGDLPAMIDGREVIGLQPGLPRQARAQAACRR